MVSSPLTFTATTLPPTKIAINARKSQTAKVGTAVAIAPSVIVRDASNIPVAGVTVTFAVATGGGSITGGTATTSAGLTGSPLTFTATGAPAVTADPPTVVSQAGGETGPGDTVTITLSANQTTSFLARDFDPGQSNRVVG
ncbi:MAG: hypothetical protein ACKOB4_02175 [Acidobacteriota bacterium]